MAAGPFYDTYTIQQFTDSEMSLNGGTNHINPDLQINNHPSHMHSDARGHALNQRVVNLQPHHIQPIFQQATAQSPDKNNAVESVKQRLKVSRACDECRRKKIRCDATTENETSSCTSCRKSNMTCQFSRTPQKRGPSKGYIKELADRVTTLERERQANGLDGDSPQPTGPAFSQEDINFLSGLTGLESMHDNSSRKRTHSISEGFSDQYTSRERDGLPPEELVSIDEHEFKSYLQSIHMTLPFLPREYHVLRSTVGNAAEPTREAFQGAFACTMKSIQYTGNPASLLAYTPKRAYELFVNSNWMDTHNLVQMQSLLLLLLESSNRGSQVIHGGHGNSPWQYLDEAISKSKDVDQFSAALGLPPANPDKDYLISRAVVLSLIILDAFLALGDKKQGSSMDPTRTTVWEQDLGIVGQRCYKLARLARILSRLACTKIIDSQDDCELHRPTRVAGRASKVLCIRPGDVDVIERLKDADMELLQSHEIPDDPVLAMAFWYSRIQIEITYYPLAKANHILYPLRRIIEQLGNARGCPITHHFSGLAAHLLIQLCTFTDTRGEAKKLLILLSNTLQDLVNSEDTQSFDAGIRDVVARKRAAISSEPSSAGLQHLADVAAGSRGTSSGESNDHISASKSFNGSRLSQDGYLMGLLFQ